MIVNTVKVLVLQHGDAECGSEGYMLKRGEKVAAFYLDGWGETGKIYPVSTCSSAYFPETKNTKQYPSIAFDSGDEECSITEVCFPEFEGWEVHSYRGGKTMSICLTKD